MFIRATETVAIVKGLNKDRNELKEFGEERGARKGENES